MVKIFVMLTILQKAVENGMWKKLFHNCYIFLPNWVGHTTFFSCLEVDKNWLKLMLRETGGKTSLKTRLDVFLFSSFALFLEKKVQKGCYFPGLWRPKGFFLFSYVSHKAKGLYSGLWWNNCTISKTALASINAIPEYQ